MTFLFNYGKDWLFSVTLSGFGEKAPRMRYPRVVARHGAAPRNTQRLKTDGEWRMTLLSSALRRGGDGDLGSGLSQWG